MKTYGGMNILEYIDYLMEEYGMDEESANTEASLAFEIYEED